MKTTLKRLSALLMVLVMSIAMTGTAFAYDPSVTVNIAPSGNSLKFSAMVKTNAPDNFVDTIYLSTESINEDTGEVISAWDGSKSVQSSLGSGYTLTRPIATAYSKWAYGEISYIADVPDDGYSDTADFYYQNKRNEKKKLIAKRDAVIADSFDIDLSDYRILNPPEKEYFEKKLLVTRKQVNVRGGDTVPITYINPEESIVYVIKQDAYGMNYLYKFKTSGDGWMLDSSDHVQGVKMEPSNQAESLRLRKTEEVEELFH